MISRRTVLLLPLALGSVAACSPTAPQTGGALRPVGSASGASTAEAQAAALLVSPRSETTLSAAAFAEALEEPGTVLLDVRTPAEFAEGHLEGAINLDMSAGGFEAAIADLDPAVPYAVYCRSGNRSARALAVMEHLGFEHAFHLDGGIGAWERSGRPVVTP